MYNFYTMTRNIKINIRNNKNTLNKICTIETITFNNIHDMVTPKNNYVSVCSTGFNIFLPTKTNIKRAETTRFGSM